MRISSFLGLTAALFGGAALAASACGDETALVRPRLNGNGLDGAVGPLGEGGTGLACGAAVPVSYVSANFAANAAVELAFAQHVTDLDTAMSNTEGSSTAVATTADLGGIFNAGLPSLRSVSTTDGQTLMDGYLAAFGAAAGKTWQPTDAAKDGGAATGGKYQALFYESPIGVDIRQAVDNALLGTALYNHVLGITAAPITDVSVDQLLASFGASEALANTTDVDAGGNGDRLIAALASKRDDKSSPTPGIYRQMKTALLTMKAAVAAGDRCKSDLDAAVATFLIGWEHATYASAIFSLNAAATTAADPTKGALALHSLGAAIGLVESFKGLPADKRKITDSQIELILTTMSADTPYELITAPGTRVLALTDAINGIALYEGFDTASVETYKQSF